MTVWVQVETPVGTRAEVTDRIVQRLETEMGEIDGRVDYESVVATTGSKIADFGSQTGTQYATVAVSFVDFELREHDTNETLETMRSLIGGDVAGADITVAKPSRDRPPDVRSTSRSSERTSRRSRRSAIGWSISCRTPTYRRSWRGWRAIWTTLAPSCALTWIARRRPSSASRLSTSAIRCEARSTAPKPRNSGTAKKSTTSSCDWRSSTVRTCPCWPN